MTRAEWDAAMAEAIALVEAERAAQLEAIVDARCPGSRRGVDGRAKDLAGGVTDGYTSRVQCPSANALPDGLGFE